MGAFCNSATHFRLLQHNSTSSRRLKHFSHQLVLLSSGRKTNQEMMPLKVFSLLFISVSVILADMESNGFSAVVNNQSFRPLQRRYSEAILASDYSKTVDNMLKKNFVDWLLTRREKKSETMTDPAKRDGETQVAPPSSHGSGASEENSQGSKNIFAWLLKNRRKESSSGDILDQELADLLISNDFSGRRVQ
ncbi:gastric inhibitory polypeptide [Microcaecilia unicolor]|uniref:Gastric inhibitory polypeptide n=1 Tax=Microcaecilia unicolor TaxID=1415580 RepID=A0A6P7ZLX9_9AMPH|nr:glucagon-1-like [Microcaecilia unicolor]